MHRHDESTARLSEAIVRYAVERTQLDPALLRASAEGLSRGLVHAAWIIVVLSVATLATSIAFPRIATADVKR